MMKVFLREDLGRGEKWREGERRTTRDCRFLEPTFVSSSPEYLALCRVKSWYVPYLATKSMLSEIQRVSSYRCLAHVNPTTKKLLAEELYRYHSLANRGFSVRATV